MLEMKKHYLTKLKNAFDGPITELDVTEKESLRQRMCGQYPLKFENLKRKKKIKKQQNIQELLQALKKLQHKLKTCEDGGEKIGKRKKYLKQ